MLAKLLQSTARLRHVADDWRYRKGPRMAAVPAAHALTLLRLRRRAGDTALTRAYHALSARINRGDG